MENTGSRSGEEVVQLYLKASGAAGPHPIGSPAGFERAPRRAKKKTVRFTLSPRQFSGTQAGGHGAVEPGTFEISIGGGQAAAVTGRVQMAGPAKELN